MTKNQWPASAPYSFPGIVINHNKVEYSVCMDYGMTIDALQINTRKPEICVPRMICMFLFYELFQTKLKTIGLRYSRDHATVIHARKTVTNDYQYDRVFRERFDKLLGSIGLSVDNIPALA